MALTVREKEHWKERIARRIDHAIETLQAKEDPGFRERIRKESDQQAWESLGLAALRDECRQIEVDIKCLESRRRDAWADMLSKVSGTPANEIRGLYCEPREVHAAVNRRIELHERELLSKTSLGKQILRLREEKEELLDTVWLATSPSQIKELWTRFAEVLNWEPPKLQREALAIEPLPAESLGK